MNTKLNEISIEITQKCTNNCIHCSSFSSCTMTTYIPYKLITHTVDDAKKLGAKVISLSGGEPFLHEDIMRIIDYVCSCGLNCYVYTSGIFFSNNGVRSIPQEMLVKIAAYKNVKMIVNYEASNSNIYNTIMGTDFNGFRLMRNTIRKCVKLHIPIEAHVVPMKTNLKQINKIVTQCAELGISKVSFLRLVLQGRAIQNQELTKLNDNDVTSFKNLINKIRQTHTIGIRLGIPFGDCTCKINCQTSISKLNIRYDGMVFPCEAFKNNMPVDFIHSQPDSIYNHSLSEIYNNSEYLKEVRKKLMDFQNVKTCENCVNQYYRAKI